MRDIRNEFVTYELALRMKVIGFDNFPCLAIYYNVPVMDDYEYFDFTNHFSYTHYETQYYANKGFKDAVLAPTWQSAFAWFRGKYNIHIRIEKYDETKWWANWGSWTSEVYGSYEEAELACLEKLCEIVENK